MTFRFTALLLISILILSSTRIYAADSYNYPELDLLITQSIKQPNANDVWLATFSQRCKMAKANHSPRDIIRIAHSCLWAGKLSIANKNTSYNWLDIGQKLIEPLFKTTPNSSELFRIHSHLLMYQMDMKGYLFQIRNANKLMTSLEQAMNLDANNPRAILNMALFKLHAPQIAGGNSKQAVMLLQSLTDSTLIEVNYEARLQLCLYLTHELKDTNETPEETNLRCEKQALESINAI